MAIPLARWVALGIVTTATVAGADPSHRELGAAHYAKGDYAAAAAEFRLCIATEQRPDCSFALAQALRVLGDCPGAVRSYKDFLATQPAAAENQAAREAITACGATYEPVAVEAAPAPPRDVPPPPPPREHSAWYRDRLAVTALVAGGLATAAGATSLWLSARAHDDAAQLGTGAGSLPEFEDKLDDAHRYRWIGAVALGVGGALLVTATVKLLVTDRDAAPTTASISLTGDGVMVTRSLTF